MANMNFSAAIDRAVMEAMAADKRVIIMGEDVHMLRSAHYTRFGQLRVFPTPISESSFVGAAVGAAMSGLRPIVEVMLVDFVGVAMDAVLNHMAKIETFSGGKWTCPLVVRTACGGGYGDGGQHEQTLWGMFAGIPGLTVVVPSNPADAYGLMKTAIAHDGPVIFLEHKLLSDSWLEFLGRLGRQTVAFDVPSAGAQADVPAKMDSLPLGQARVLRTGDTLTMVSLAVGLHRALEAADQLADQGMECDVIDLRCLQPLDIGTINASVRKTGKLLVVDEDYKSCGLSGELAAIVMESGLSPCYARVCLEQTIPYARHLEAEALPNTGRIVDAALRLAENTE
ncbi:MAG: alpha-ketoacid dehydrogenase subunit beta [Pirellulaceae bacterium]